MTKSPIKIHSSTQLVGLHDFGLGIGLGGLLEKVFAEPLGPWLLHLYDALSLPELLGLFDLLSIVQHHNFRLHRTQLQLLHNLILDGFGFLAHLVVAVGADDPHFVVVPARVADSQMFQFPYGLLCSPVRVAVLSLHPGFNRPSVLRNCPQEAIADQVF